MVTFHSMFQKLQSFELMLQSMLPKVKVALKNFMKFTGKHLYWSLSSLKVAGCLQIFQNFQRSLFHVAAENTTLKATKTVNQKET